jgi:hypothetical protein
VTFTSPASFAQLLSVILPQFASILSRAAAIFARRYQSSTANLLRELDDHRLRWLVRRAEHRWMSPSSSIFAWIGRLLIVQF